MKWSAKQSIRIGFTALASFIVILGLLFYFQINRARETGDAVIESYELMARTELLFRQLKDAELNAYDYVITGDVPDRERYEAIREINGHMNEEANYDSSFDENLEELRKLTADKIDQQKLDQLALLLHKEITFLDHVVELRKKQGVNAATGFMRTGDDEPIITEIEQILLFFKTEEKKILEQRIAEDEESDAHNKHIIISAFTIALSAIGAAYFFIMRDLARRLKAEDDLRETSQWQHAILDSSPYAIIATDAQGIIHTYNPAAEELFGYTAEEMIGKETPALLHDQEELNKRAAVVSQELGRPVGHGFETIIAKVNAENEEEREWTFMRKDGIRLPVLSNVTALKNAQGRISGYLKITKDITEQKRMERMKTEFISTVSHELRTPLTSIRGALGLIAGGAVGELPVKVKDLVGIAHKNSERLVRIVNDILDVEKIESGKMQLLMQQVDLTSLVKQAIEANHAYAQKHHVGFVLEHAPDSAYLMADPDRIMQVMANLLSNAAKFSPGGSEVIIRVDHSGSNIRVSVQDHGPGISEQFRSRIFEKFAQADSSATRRHEGTGLGLSITKKLTEAMNGTIGFTTETGKGSIFYVDLPALVQEEVTPLETTAATQVYNRVLIVEDDKDIVTLLKMLLEQAGFAVDTAYTLAEARAKLRGSSYIAMTLDLGMPDGDGVALIRELRSQPAMHDLPIIVVSAKAEQGKQALSGDAVGLVDWLVKPIDENQLVQALRRSTTSGEETLPRILHVEDDTDISHIIREMLKDQAEIVTASTLKEARLLLLKEHFALIVLDLTLPDGSGAELLKHLNTLNLKPSPVLILSATEATADIRAQVAGVLVKSRMSETKIVDTILSLIHKSSGSKEAA